MATRHRRTHPKKSPNRPLVSNNRFFRGPVFDPFLGPPFSLPMTPSAAFKSFICDFNVFWDPFWHPFSIKFRCQKTSRKWNRKWVPKVMKMRPWNIEIMALALARCVLCKHDLIAIWSRKSTKMDTETTHFWDPFCSRFGTHF